MKLSVREAAGLLSVSERAIYRWVEDGEIRGRHKGQRARLCGARQTRRGKGRRKGCCSGKTRLQHFAAAHDPPPSLATICWIKV